jgi:hypothetical protein
VSVECCSMSNPETSSLEAAQKELEERLRVLDEQLRSEMRARGFDPAQDQNLALTGPLARLYMERENLREKLETLAGSENTNEVDDDRD